MPLSFSTLRVPAWDTHNDQNLTINGPCPADKAEVAGLSRLTMISEEE